MEATLRAGHDDWWRAMRACLFAVTGIAGFGYWTVGRPSLEMMREWPHVVWFSATLLSLAVAIPTFGRMAGGRLSGQLATVAGAGAGLSSIANVVEDGFGIDGAFFVFTFGSLVMAIALVALSVVLARNASGWFLLFALVPAGTVIALALFVTLGGPVLLVTWLAAAAAATVVRPRPSPATT